MFLPLSSYILNITEYFIVHSWIGFLEFRHFCCIPSQFETSGKYAVTRLLDVYALTYWRLVKLYISTSVIQIPAPPTTTTIIPNMREIRDWVIVDRTRSIGIILSPFHSGSMQNYQNFIYNYCVLKTKIKYLVSYLNFKI